MPRKKVNTEIQQGVHNPPEQLFLKFGKIKLYKDNLFSSPKVIVHHVQFIQSYEIIQDWLIHNKIKYTNVKDWLDITSDITDIITLPEDDRKELFRLYRETQLAKLDQAIRGLKRIAKSDKYIWNDILKLPRIYRIIHDTLHIYQVVRNNLTKSRTGKHQLLYDLLLPLLTKLRKKGYSDFYAKEYINGLLTRLGYDYPDIARELIKYEKKEYSPPNIVKQLNPLIK